MTKENILISACLLGEKVRYDGKHLLLEHKIIRQWMTMSALIPICPEVAGGLNIPRPPAEIQASPDQSITVHTIDNRNVTQAFSTGAKIVLEKCQQHKIKMAILTEGSPSCGSSFINDGSFSKNKIMGEGVTTMLLRQNGIKVFSQYQLQQADEFYQQLNTIKKGD